MSACLRCRSEFSAGSPPSHSCDRCLPVACADCGGGDDRYCPCWVSVDTLSAADLKGLLAGADLSLRLHNEANRVEAGEEP